MAPGLVLLAAAAWLQPGPVIADQWPAGDVAAVTVVIGVRAKFVPRRLAGLTALYAELMMNQMQSVLRRKDQTGRLLAQHMPGQRAIDVVRRRDYLAVTVNVVSAGLDPALDLLRKAVLSPPPTDGRMEAARRSVLRRRDAWIGSVIEPTEELLVRAIWPARLGDVMYGPVETINKATAQDLRHFAKALLQRGNVWICLSGPLGDPTEAKTKGQQLLADLPDSELKPIRAPMGYGGRVEVEDNPAIDQASLAVGAALPEFGTPGYWAGHIIRELLDGPGGRLYADRALASRLGLIIPRSLQWQRWPVRVLPIQLGSAPYLAVHVICHPSRVEVARQGVVRHLERIAAGDFSAAELERARARVANGWARQTAAARDRCRMIAVAALLGKSLPDAGAVYHTVQGIDKAAVQALAQDLVRHLAVGLQMPRP